MIFHDGGTFEGGSDRFSCPRNVKLQLGRWIFVLFRRSRRYGGEKRSGNLGYVCLPELAALLQTFLFCGSGSSV